MAIQHDKKLQFDRLMGSAYSDIDGLFEHVRNFLVERNRYVKILLHSPQASHPDIHNKAINAINGLNKNINLILNTN